MIETLLFGHSRHLTTIDVIFAPDQIADRRSSTVAAPTLKVHRRNPAVLSFFFGPAGGDGHKLHVCACKHEDLELMVSNNGKTRISRVLDLGGHLPLQRHQGRDQLQDLLRPLLHREARIHQFNL